MKQYNRIADEILKLDTFPERFRIMDSEPEKRMELRRMLVDNYSVFYTIRDKRVIVTDVLYTASDIEIKSSLRLSVYQKNTRAIAFYQREQFVIRSVNINDSTNEKEFLMTWSK